MSPVLVRFFLSLGLIVLLPALYVALFITLSGMPRMGDDVALLISDVLAALLFAFGWLAIWWRHVRWTGRRVLWTLVATLVTVSAVVVLGVAVIAAGGMFPEIVIILTVIAWGGLWVGAIGLVWRETPAERMARLSGTPNLDLRCPQCRYDLRGLQEARCPECGRQYTLDELLGLLLGQNKSVDVG